MLGKKKAGDEEPSLLVREGHAVARLNDETYRWLGERYLWYNKIRTAKKEGFSFLGSHSLEEKMEATRSALQLLTRNLNNALAIGFNGTLESLKKMAEPPEGLPEKVEVPDRGNPPSLDPEQDALIIAFMPMRFLNLAKTVREKGKGVDLYSEGLIKKLCFKVVAYYCEPANWQPERLAYFMEGLSAESPLADYSQRLAPLKQELEIFASSLEVFKFGQQPRGPKDPADANSFEDTQEITVHELVRDLFLQSFILTGMGNFLFRYYLTLITRVKNPRALRLISHAFLPALAKVEAVRIRFQASFATERNKIKLRSEYQAFYKQVESKPLVETVKQKGGEVRKINYCHRLLEMIAYARHGVPGEKQAQRWKELLAREVVAKVDSGGGATLMEILNMMTRITQFDVEGKLEVVRGLRSFSEEQEKLGIRTVSAKRKILVEAKRNKIRTASKFKSTKQFDMVKTIEAEAAEIEKRGNEEIEKLEQSIAQRKESFLNRAKKMEETALSEGREDRCRSAAALYAVAADHEQEAEMRQAFVQFVMASIQEDSELAYVDFYKNVFEIVPGLYPTEKVLLRKALESKAELKEDEMAISPEDERAYQENIVTLKTEINMEAPGTFDQRFMHKTVNTTLDHLMEAGLTQDSLALLMTLPVNLPNKPPVKMAKTLVKKLLWLNQLSHPFAETDIILPNVDAGEAADRRINFNRLAKVVG